MKLMIDISDSTYEAIMARDWKNAGWLFSEELKAIHDGTPIPENATNSDMIKIIFPNGELFYFGRCLNYRLNNANFQAAIEWWNARYKRGETE